MNATGEMEFFDDLINHKQTGRISFIFKKSTNDILGVWEIVRFIDDFFESYYKCDLLNCLSSALMLGIDPSDIFLLDQSIRINRSSSAYSLNHISLSSEIIDDNIYQLYTIGKPKSLQPNDAIFLLNRVFHYSREINKFLTDHKYSSIGYHFVSSFSSSVLTDKISYHEFLTILRSNAVKQLGYFKDDRNDIYKKHVDSIDAIIHKAKIEYDNHSAKTDFTKNELSGYVNSFFSSFKKIKRPVMGIYYRSLQMIQIFGLTHINNDYNASNFLDLKTMGHSSEYSLGFIGDIITSFGTLKKVFGDDRRAEEIHKLALEEKHIDIEIKRYMMEEAKNKAIQSLIKTEIEKMKYFREKENAGNIFQETSKHIDKDNCHTQIKKQMSLAHNKLQSDAYSLMKSAHFELNQVDKLI